MKATHHLSEEHISFYYDGLLDPLEKQIVEEHLEECDLCMNLLKTFQSFDAALQPEFSEEELQRLLSNTVQEVHNRIIESDRLNRTSSQPAWAWLLMPRNLLAGLAVVILFCGSFALLNQNSNLFITMDDSLIEVTEELTPPPPLSAPQKEAIIQIARWARSTAGTGIDYAKEKKVAVDDTLSTLHINTDKAISQTILFKKETTTAETPSNTPNALQKLAAVGQEQITFGLGTTMLSLIL